MIIVGLFSANCVAQQDCTSRIDDDDYYDLQDNRVLSTKDESQLTEFAARLIGDWRGELVQTECKGNIKTPNKIIDTSYANVTIRGHTINNLQMEAELDFRQQNKKTLYFRPFFETRDLHSYLFNGPDIVIMTEKKYQYAYPYGGSTLIETIYKVMLTDERMQLDIITISNGFFSVEERWSLIKR